MAALRAYLVEQAGRGSSRLGVDVHELFVEHLKKTKVNVIGAFILANDVNRLQGRLMGKER
ncbi:expressed unknown protein [Ectocarpus siliculosus]|uniref:Exocyst complex component Sec10-like alpha-helical bundle domain-containing protein n=1 Tax=Ectocarpus siliculosus TaxID=2880 RepID=D7G534_ECTSI|nr:expressed unknown protein [Ectocarpus siliculosus]|eukprot:CBJ33797.1 expressed unknown protein [Ectocarpus siliculosus]